jgi:serine/threonine-protein kinase HipA
MRDTLEVHIKLGHDTHRVGTLYSHMRGSSESSTFIYHEDWLENRLRFPIQPDMPLVRGSHHVSSENGSLPGAIRDGSPDRWGRKLIQRAMAKAREPVPVSEVGFLISLDDHSRIGALRYRSDETEDFLRASKDRRIPPLLTIPRLMNAADAVHTETATAEDLGYLLGHGSPLGGARPKSAIVEEDGTLAIAKFPKPDDIRNWAAGEVLMGALARHAGIDAAASRMLRIEGRPVSIIRRFDREPDGARHHFISAMTMVGAREGEKGTYTDIALAIRRFGAEPTRDLHELFRRAALSVLGSNYDDHLRNHGFLYLPASGKWRLSPAYDMNPVPNTERPRHLETWISEGGSEATLDRLFEVAHEFALKPAQARQIVSDVANVTRQWREIGRQVGLTDSDLAPYASAFMHDELRAAFRLGLQPAHASPSPVSPKPPKSEPSP